MFWKQISAQSTKFCEGNRLNLRWTSNKQKCSTPNRPRPTTGTVSLKVLQEKNETKLERFFAPKQNIPAGLW